MARRLMAVAMLLAFAAICSCQPAQIHIGRADVDGTAMFISFTLPMTVSDAYAVYGTDPLLLTLSGKLSNQPFQYTFQSPSNDTMYTSPMFYHFVIAALQPVTKYYYQCGSASAGAVSAVLSFTTTPAPGPNVPVVLGLLGDLGQTPDSATTVQHIMSDQSIQMTFLVGDLSYADAENKASKSRPCSQDRWDAWSEVMQPMMSSQAVLPLPGNHEPEDVTKVYPQYPRFLSFQSRFRTPSIDSGVAASDQNLYYTFRVGAAQVIALSSYSPFDSSSAQYQWLQNTLAKVDRTVTPWLIVGFHAPWYNSNTAHQGEPQSTDMRQDIEPLLLQAGVDVAFAGHVHAYERVLPSASAPQNGITYINIGDGGNREGPADNWMSPAPDWSAYREAKFGHGRLHVYNHTHMHWTWQKNEDSLPVAGDQVWLIRPAGRSPLQSGFGGGIDAVPGKRE